MFILGGHGAFNERKGVWKHSGLQNIYIQESDHIII